LKKEDLQLVPVPLGNAPEGTFSQPPTWIGRSGIHRAVVKNEAILAAKLA